MAVEREVLVETPVDRFAGMRISWGGVFGGVLAGIGTLLLLTSLGLAVGISSVDPQNPDGSAIGTGAAIWTALTLLIALFVGGWASTRLSMLWERTTAMFEGALVWVLSMMLILYLTANGIGLVASGAFGILGQTAQAAGPTGATAMIQELWSGDPDQIMARLNDPQTADRLASMLNMPREQVSATLASLSARVQASRGDPAQVAAQVQQGVQPLVDRAQERLSQTAAQVQPEATTTAWLTFAALVLSLLAAIAGAAVGRRNVENRVASDTAVR